MALTKCDRLNLFPTCMLTENLEIGLGIVDYIADTLTLYRGKIDSYWNYVRVRIWVTKETP